MKIYYKSETCFSKYQYMYLSFIFYDPAEAIVKQDWNMSRETLRHEFG